jgi:3-hydroxyacyl-CoA dehydrogenase
MKTIRRVAVLGAGTMGARIAAHFANAGIPAYLFDIVLPGKPDRNAAAQNGLQTALKAKPAAFFKDSLAGLVTPGNFDDDLPKIKDCDWVIEAVTEDLGIKRSLWSRVEAVRKPGTIVSTNTSGIPLHSIAESFSDEMRQHFCGTHFFNPPRYLHLLELIPGPGTQPEILSYLREFGDRRLGKGVVDCKDTPNFIGNRIGSFVGGTVQKLTVEDDYTIEEVDALTGTLIGLPRSGSYRLLDIVGLDIWAHVSRNLYEGVPDDPWRDRFLMQPFLQTLIERKWIGDKTGQGLYKKVDTDGKREFWAIDWKTGEYRPPSKPRFPSIEGAKMQEDLKARLQLLVALPDRAGSFLWKMFRDTMIYSAAMIPEISDRVVEIDRAMKWGYANTLGPFELWDALGFVPTAKRIENEGIELPPLVQKMLSSGAGSFYKAADENGQPRNCYFDLVGSGFRVLEDRPGIISIADTRRARGVVKKNAGASLVDIGDGVLLCEFHSKMNALGDDIISMIQQGIAETEKNFVAMVIGNQGENFSVGANLMLVLLAAQEGEWDELNLAISRFQKGSMAIKYAPKPVVVAPFGYTFGGGCEVALHGARVQASAEAYMGLVEVGVGVIPAGGGCKELIARGIEPRKAFEMIGMAKVSTSAAEAREMGLLRDGDQISMNPERLIGDAKTLALSLAPTYAPGAPRTDIKVGGDDTYALLKTGLYMMRQGDYISDYDAVVGDKLAYVLSGGKASGETLVSEQYLLDLEREAFLSLCGRRETQQRISHMLKTGKPLRN